MKPTTNYRLEVYPEDTPVEGNASAIDDATDRAIAAWIYDQLARRNVWAWCRVQVTATCAGFSGTDSLGCCSYHNEVDFKQDGYYEDMKHEAYNDLLSNIRQAVTTGQQAAGLLERLKEEE